MINHDIQESNPMDKLVKITTPVFQCKIDSSMRWLELKRPIDVAYRVRYRIDDVSYEINIIIKDKKQSSAMELTEKKYSINQHSAFSAENISPFKFLNQQAGLEIWSCRYRWVDGASAPYRKQDVFIEIKDKIVHFSFMARPEYFDHGFVKFLKFIQSIQTN
jgi:hypothetical protein